MTAGDPWPQVLSRILHPARPDLERCIREGAFHREAQQRVAAGRTEALADCAARIETARAAVFAAGDGAVPGIMTTLEREWLALARSDVDGAVMSFWVRVAPPSWHDRKPWRDSDANAQLDAAIALASDVRGVEAAESAVSSLRAALGAWGVVIGARLRWKTAGGDTPSVVELLAKPLFAAEASITGRSTEPAIRRRSERIQQVVREAAGQRIPLRPHLAEDIAHAAFIDSVVLEAALVDRPNPVTPLRDLWTTGYSIVKADASGVTLELPPL